jgi:hypothetical protein
MFSAWCLLLLLSMLQLSLLLRLLLPFYASLFVVRMVHDNTSCSGCVSRLFWLRVAPYC